MKNIASEILKVTRPGKLDAEEEPCIEGCVNPNIQDKYILNPKNSPVDYDYVLLPLTKNIQGKK